MGTLGGETAPAAHADELDASDRKLLARTRWAFFASMLWGVIASADSLVWSLLLAVPIVAAAAALHLFEPRRLGTWLQRGWLCSADAALGLFAVLAAPVPRPLVLCSLGAVLTISVLAPGRRRTLLGSAGCVGGLWSVAAAGWLPGGAPGVAELVWLPLLASAAVHFGRVATQLPDTTSRYRRETDELWALLGITETVSRQLDVHAVMRSIVDRVGDLVGTSSCSILLTDSGTPDCLVLASKGHPEATMLELDLSNYPEVQRALDTQEVVHVDDVAHHPLVEPVRDVLLAKGYRSLLVLPLLYGHELIGALFIRTPREYSFPPRVQRFCRIAAGLSANALKNAMLFRNVKETGEKLRRVLDATPDLIVATDENGRITEFNRGAEQLTGVPAAAAIHRPFADLLGGAALDPGDGNPVEIGFERPDGDSVEVSLVSAPLNGEGTTPGGHVWIGRDVTKLRRVERSLAQAERLSSLGEVVAGVAHELNNPLSGVVGYAELLRAGARDPEQISDLERIVESAMRCQKIVFKLLSFARKHAPEKRFQNLNDCVEKVIDLKSYQLRSAQINTEIELDPDLPDTSFDFHQIDQVILNLMNNAEQAARSVQATGGTITIRTGTEDGQIYLDVADDGPGVAPHAAERVFDPFFTTKEIGQGTGLGLSVSYGIVQEHGGRIELRETPPGAGACFRVWLPIVEGEPVEAHAPDGSADVRPPGALHGRRILVADDEPTVLELFQRLLRDEGALVTLAQDGQEAWDLLDRESFDLVVADLRMPNVSGQELYERVAEERPELLRRFVFATGDLVRQETLRFLEGLPNRILTKPLEIETVRRVLNQAIDAAA